MPEGILIIDWDEFEGGVISFKYPDNLHIPENLVQLLQISHTFSPGLLTIRENTFHALSMGNENLQKVIVLILSQFEDGDDFNEIITTMDKAILESTNSAQLSSELIHMFELSQSVFRAREAVLTKLADEVTYLKNRETDYHQSLEWLIKHENDPIKQIIFLLMRYGSLLPTEIQNYLGSPPTIINIALGDLIEKKCIEIRDQRYYLLIHYYFS